jgi:hypothetical protein
MTAKTTNRRTAMSGFLGSKAFERLLIVAAVAAVLVAFGAWYAMARPAEAGAAAARSTAAAGAPGATSTEAPTADAPAAGTPASDAPAAEASAAETPATDAPAAEAPAAETPATDVPAAEAPAADAPEAAPQAFLEEVTDSGLAPPVDDAQKLAMARDVCEEMGHGSTPDDMVRALTFAGASDEEAANFVQLAVTNICPEHAA